MCYLSPLGHLISSLMSSTTCRWAYVGKRGKEEEDICGDKSDGGGGVEELYAAIRVIEIKSLLHCGMPQISSQLVVDDNNNL